MDELLVLLTLFHKVPSLEPCETKSGALTARIQLMTVRRFFAYDLDIVERDVKHKII